VLAPCAFSLGRRLFVKAGSFSSTLRRFAGTRHSEGLAYTATATVVSGCQTSTVLSCPVLSCSRL
jgi:hypothetical protein